MTQAIFLHTPGKELNMNINYIFRAFLYVFARHSLSCFQTVFQRREPVAGVTGHSHLQIQTQIKRPKMTAILAETLGYNQFELRPYTP